MLEGVVLHFSTLLMQIGVIVIAARLVGRAFRIFHQPQVVGEILAGILLGPSFIGWIVPDIASALFPAASLGYLSALSQLGLLLFMFLVGLELDPHLLRERAHASIVISFVSMGLPFLLGTVLAVYLHPRLSDPAIPVIQFALFVGTAMSITAFPVLARILDERHLVGTHLGTVALACAAVDDVTAWCILAGVVLLVRSTADELPFWRTLLAIACYVGIMVVGLRPVLRRIEASYRRQSTITHDLLACILLLVLASAWVTEYLTIHALFGAFLLGAIMPKDQQFVQVVTEKIDGLTVVMLLPLFFALTGLRTSIGLISGVEMWLYCGLIMVVAIAGKFGGCALAARLSGIDWREAGALGILMNTRGLVELVVLNVGLEIGVISSEVFTMMVLMALATTMMTSPFLEWMYPAHRRVATDKLPGDVTGFVE